MVSVMVSRLMIFLLLTTVLIVTGWPFIQAWIGQRPVIAGILALGVSMPFLILFKQSRAILLSSLKSERIAIAEVHAAILSIFIAALSAYALLGYGRLDQIQQDALEKADKINNFGYKSRYYGDPTIRTYAESDAKNRQELLERFNILAYGSSRFSSWDPPRNPEDQGYQALSIMSALSMYYPFPPAQVMSNSETGTNIGKPQPLSFTTMEQLRQWVSDLELIAGTIANSRQRSQLQRSLTELYIREMEEARRKLLDMPSEQRKDLTEKISNFLRKESPELTPYEIEGMMIGVMVSKNLAESIFDQMQEALNIARSVKSSLQSFDVAKKRQPIGETLGGLIGAGVAFLCGVLLPMFWHNVPVILLLCVPSGFYIIAFAYIMFSVWKSFVV